MSSDIMEVKYFMKSHSNLCTVSMTALQQFHNIKIKDISRNHGGTKSIMDFNLLYLWRDAVTSCHATTGTA